ncbi:MAG: DivIVA domain-containing protein [Candidatus Hydrogenedentes bacterium]|nr:DivIVA domain-containing protein [Candidatus Hydrogenedentota bacterium]
MRKDRVVGEVLGEEKTLSPSDFYNTDFKTAMMGGYDKKEVDAFLERVGDVFEALITQVRELKEEIEQQRDRIESSREMESTLRNALASAQKFHEDTLDSARREAAAIREQAKVALARGRQRARELPDGLRREIGQLESEREQLRADLSAVLKTHEALLINIPRAEEFETELDAKDLDAAELETAGVEPESGAGEPWPDEQD